MAFRTSKLMAMTKPAERFISKVTNERRNVSSISPENVMKCGGHNDPVPDVHMGAFVVGSICILTKCCNEPKTISQ